VTSQRNTFSVWHNEKPKSAFMSTSLDEWVVGYLTTLYHLQMLFGVIWYERMIMFGELEKTVEEAVMTYFKVLSVIHLEGLRTTRRHMSQNSRVRTGRIPKASQKPTCSLCLRKQTPICVSLDIFWPTAAVPSHFVFGCSGFWMSCRRLVSVAEDSADFLCISKHMRC
jgi:hypothetical protein